MGQPPQGGPGEAGGRPSMPGDMNLDGETEAEILKIFSRLAHDENKCVIIVTHFEEVCEACDEVYALKSKKDLEEEMLQEKEDKKKQKKQEKQGKKDCKQVETSKSKVKKNNSKKKSN